MENKNDNIKGLKTAELLICFLKNKNQSDVNTKWKNAWTTLSKLVIWTTGISLDLIKQKNTIKPDQAIAVQR